MNVYIAFDESNELKTLSPTRTNAQEILLAVDGRSYVDARMLFDAGFVYNALLILVYGCTTKVPSGNDLYQARKKASRLAIDPQYALVRRIDSVVAEIYGKLDYREVSALKSKNDFWLVDIFSKTNFDENFVGVGIEKIKNTPNTLVSYL